MHGYVLLEGREIDIADVAAASNKDTAGAKNFLESGFRAVTMMPMLREGTAIGVISVVRKSPGPLSAQQLSVLRAFAAQAVIAVENTRLMNELRLTNSTLENVSKQLAKYISPQLYSSIIDGEQDVAIKSQRKKLTIFFSDIAGFTEITDQLESEELTALLNEYLTEMSAIAERHGANFDKFIGDAMMCYFGDPESRGVKEDADACVRMALDMQQRLKELEAGWHDKGVIDRPFAARIGINTGYCTVGNFGSEERMDHTIIGSEVNLAARLESEAEPGKILLANETYSLVKDWVGADEREPISVKGFARPIRTYQIRKVRAATDTEEQVLRHDVDGLALAIDRGKLSPDDAIRELETAITRLRESK
jgi:class 3 adenylate cyclase